MKNYKNWLFFSLGLLLLNVGMFTYLMQIGPPLPFHRNETQVGVEVKPVQVSESTKIYIQDSFELCSEANLSCSKPQILLGEKRQQLNGLGVKEIGNIYSKYDRWQIEVLNNGEKLIIGRMQKGLCPIHGAYYHFAAESGRIIAYFGPAIIEKKGGVALDTKIQLDTLPVEFAERVHNGQWEFTSWDELQAVVDSLDE